MSHRNSNFFILVSFVCVAGCAQSPAYTPQPQIAAAGRATVTEKQSTEQDSKAVESYWTKDIMNKATPMPTPTVIVPSDSTNLLPEPSFPFNGQGTPGRTPDNR